jgi:hypothetical protein
MSPCIHNLGTRWRWMASFTLHKMGGGVDTTADTNAMEKINIEGLTTVKMSTLISWVVTPCGLVSRYRRFGRTWCLQPRWLTASKRRYLSISLQSVTPQKTSMYRNIPCRESNLGIESELPWFLGSEWNSLWCSCKAGAETVRHTPRSRHQISFKMKAVHKDTILSYEGPWKYTSEFRCVQVVRCLRCHVGVSAAGAALQRLFRRAQVLSPLGLQRQVLPHEPPQPDRSLDSSGQQTSWSQGEQNATPNRASRNTLFSYWISPAPGSCLSSTVIVLFHSISLPKLSTNA